MNNSLQTILATALLVSVIAGPSIALADPIPPGKEVVWTKIPGGALRELAVGGATDSIGNYTIQHWTGTAWETIPGRALKIAVDPNGTPWVITAQGNIFRRNTHFEGGWEQQPGGATDIAIGGNGAVFVVGGNQRGVDNALFSWNGSSRVSLPGRGVRVAVEGSGTPWLMNAAGVPWRQDATVAGGWRQMPGSISDISAGVPRDGVPERSATPPETRRFSAGMARRIGIQPTARR